MTQSKRKLTNFLINPAYQIKVAIWTLITGLVLTAVNAGIFYGYIHENYKILVDMSPMEDEAKVQLYKELNEILMYLSGFSVIFALVMFVLGIILSHRTAGPLFNFKKIFLAIQAGDPNARIRLRPSDEFKDVAEECNKMIDFLQGKT